jgi:hypothetical protein
MPALESEGDVKSASLLQNVVSGTKLKLGDDTGKFLQPSKNDSSKCWVEVNHVDGTEVKCVDVSSVALDATFRYMDRIMFVTEEKSGVFIRLSKTEEGYCWIEIPGGELTEVRHVNLSEITPA